MTGMFATGAVSRDANDEELETDLDKLEPHDSLSYRFSTAWSPAEGAFRAMTEQHPELSFEFHCEEEQGWGVVYDGNEGVLFVSKEWEIPNSHADYVELDREDSCLCGWQEKTENWFEDCPRPSVEVIVAQNTDTRLQHRPQPRLGKSHSTLTLPTSRQV